MKLTDLTAIGRPIDPHYPTNRAIALLCVVAAVGAAAGQRLSGLSWADSLSWGLSAALALFLAWALGRELDPDHDLSAFVGVVLALAGLILFGLPSLSLLFWVLVALRILDRTVGLPARFLDSLLLFGLGGWLAWDAGWVYGLATAAAFALDARLPSPLRRHLLFAAAALAWMVASLLLGQPLRGGGSLSLSAALSILATSALFLPAIAVSRRLHTLCDVSGQPLEPRRVQVAQGFALAAALLAAWWQGDAAVVWLLPLWAAILGTALYALGLALGRLRRRGAASG